MSTINYAQKEISCKIVYYGPGLCGKTTNLQFIHEMLPQRNRGELVSLATQQDRTLFFDFLPLDLGKVKGFDTKFHLYTVPGQVYYNATRKLVLRGVDGIVFVADSQQDRLSENLRSLENLRDNLLEYGYDLKSIPWVIQYNKRDLDNISTIEELQNTLNPEGIPSFEAVATTGGGVKETLKAISSLVLERIRQSTTETEKRAARSSPGGITESKPQAAPPESAVVPDLFLKSQSPGYMGEREMPLRGQEHNEDPLSEILPITRESDVFWAGLRIGSGSLKIIPDGMKGSRIGYRLSGTLRILGIIRKTVDQPVVYRGKRTGSLEGRQVDYTQFMDPPDNRPAFAEPFLLWIDLQGGARLFFAIGTSLVTLHICPKGQKPLKRET